MGNRRPSRTETVLTLLVLAGVLALGVVGLP